jgi:hypothetical protein
MDALTKLETATQQMEQAVDRMRKGGAESAEGVGDLISALNQMLGGSAESKPIGAKELKALLPKQLTGLKRVEVSAEQHSPLGIAAAMASGLYEDSKGGRITLAITDAGNVSGLASFAAGMVGTSETVTDTGYEKTFTSGNRKVHEKFDRQAKSGSLDMLIDDRFLITAEGYGVDINRLKHAANKIDVGRLAAIKMRSTENELRLINGFGSDAGLSSH